MKAKLVNENWIDKRPKQEVWAADNDEDGYGPNAEILRNVDDSDEKIFSKNDVKKILRSIVGYSKEQGRLCGDLDQKIRMLARKHNIKL